jgi:hypothetical protein
VYKICYFVPESHLEATKAALFGAGAARIGDYDHCCWQVLGTGQFRPLPGGSPFVGTIGELEQLAEFRVELVCANDVIRAAIAALAAAHPSEAPAYDVWRLEDL